MKNKFPHIITSLKSDIMKPPQWKPISDPYQVPLVGRLCKMVNILQKMNIALAHISEEKVYEVMQLVKMRLGEKDTCNHVISDDELKKRIIDIIEKEKENG